MELLENLPVRNKKINFKKEIAKYLKRWYWFALSMFLLFFVAQIYLRYAEKQYLTKSTLRIRQSENRNSSSALSDLKNLGMGVSGDDELLTETSVIVSKPILEKVVDTLNLYVKFYGIGKVKEVELYDAPLSVKITQFEPRFSGASYEIKPIGKNSYELKGISGTFNFGTLYHFPFGMAKIDIIPGRKFQDVLKLEISTKKQEVANLEKNLKAEIPQDKGYILELSIIGTIPQKSEDILNEISKQYNLDGILDKNEEARNTQDFITKRLNIITGDLLGVENQKEGFKRNNQIADLETQAKLSLQNASENTKAIIEYRTQLDLVNSLYVAASASGEKLLPSNLGLSPGTEKLISDYNDLVLVRNKTLKQATNANPAVIEMNKEIASLKNIIQKNLSDSRSNLSQSISNLENMVNTDKAKITEFPQQEKISRSIERELNLKEQLYLYLLQKREENAITLAVTAPIAKVVNPAYTIGVIKPNKSQIVLGSLAIGFLLPLLLFYTQFSLDTKIHKREDITDTQPEATIIGEIPQNENDNELVGQNDFTVFAESFRIMCSNLKFIFKAKKMQNGGVLLVTSSIKGEGKTTISMNTALTLSAKSKVLIIGADIRNPQLQRYVSESAKGGLTDYLISEDTDPSKYILKSGLNSNLDILKSGTSVPNPNDLLDMQKFKDVLLQLRKKYEYIIIDSAPAMLVSDTLHLTEQADVMLYVVKADYTEKEMLDFAENFRKDNQIANMIFVLNGVKKENTRYGKKYAYGYYHEDTKKGLRKFF